MPRGGKRPNSGRKRGVKTGPYPRTLALRRAVQKSLDLSATNTLEQIRRGAMFDVRALFDDKGNFRPIQQLSAEAAAMIAGFDLVKRNITSGDGAIDTVLKVRLVDRCRYVEMAAKHHGLLTEKVEHSGGLKIIHEYGS